MNKLTEIKEALKEATPGPWKDSHFDNLNKSYVDGCRTICTCETSNRMSDARLISNAPGYITYLLSLLEEKDKALAFYADIKNHLSNDESCVLINTNVALDSGLIARKALNTSSNNKGEI